MPKQKNKTQNIITEIHAHFEDHFILTQDDFELLLRKEYQAEIRRRIPEDEGAPVLDFDFIICLK